MRQADQCVHGILRRHGLHAAAPLPPARFAARAVANYGAGCAALIGGYNRLQCCTNACTQMILRERILQGLLCCIHEGRGMLLHFDSAGGAHACAMTFLLHRKRRAAHAAATGRTRERHPVPIEPPARHGVSREGAEQGDIDEIPVSTDAAVNRFGRRPGGGVC
jgi:hypothetical protein